MLAKVCVGQKPGVPVYVSEEDFIVSLTKTASNGRLIVLNSDATEWARGGRLGSRFQIDTHMYVKVKDQDDSPFNYYMIPQEEKSALGPNPLWSRGYDADSGSGCEEEGGGGCGGGCGGKKKGGCGGGCP